MLRSGSVAQAMALMHELDAPSRQKLANALAITGMRGLVSMVYNRETGQLQSLSIVGGADGFAVHYDGSGKFVVEKGGVKHGSVELDNSGRIKGFETSVQVGGLNLEYVKTRAQEISEIAKAYSQVGEAFKTIASKGIKAVDLKSLRDNLSKIVQSNFDAFLEAARAWGVDKDIVQAILKTVGQKHEHSFGTTDATKLGGTLGVRGAISVGKGAKEGGGFGLINLGGGVYFDANVGRYYTDEEVRRMAAYLSRDEKNELVNKFVESLQNKSGQRSSESQAKKDEQSYTQGKDVSEEASNSKVYEVAEAFGKMAEEMFAYANRLQASLRQDPLNYYAQQKYEEALEAGKSEGEAVKYAIEEVAKLRSNPSALEKWLNEFAQGQGIRGPRVDEKKLEGIQKEVPKPEDIQEKGKQLQGEVLQQIDATRKEISQGRDELRTFNPRKARLFEFQAPNIDLRFNPKDPKLQAYEREAQKWFKEQPNPLRRAINDVKDTAIDFGNKAKQFAIDLSKTVNNIEQFNRNSDPKYKIPRYSPFGGSWHMP